MGRLLTGYFTLEIINFRPPLNSQENPDLFTKRYEAKVIKTDDTSVNPGDIVSVRMVHYDKPEDYFGMTGDFDGDVNDIQTDIREAIDISRTDHPKESYINPFGPL